MSHINPSQYLENTLMRTIVSSLHKQHHQSMIFIQELLGLNNLQAYFLPFPVIKPSISNGTSPHSTRAPAFGKMEWIFGLLLTHSVFGLFIVVSNMVVLITFFRHARLRTTTNVVLMSMALADLGVGLVMIPLWLRAINANYYSGTPFSKTEQRVFKAYPLMDQALILTSIYHLVYLHCLRSYSIVFPIRHRKMSNSELIWDVLLWRVGLSCCCVAGCVVLFLCYVVLCCTVWCCVVLWCGVACCVAVL